MKIYEISTMIVSYESAGGRPVLRHAYTQAFEIYFLHHLVNTPRRANIAHWIYLGTMGKGARMDISQELYHQRRQTVEAVGEERVGGEGEGGGLTHTAAIFHYISVALLVVYHPALK